MAKKKTDSRELENLSFEEAIEALGSIVQEIETGQVPLQESLKQYEKGMALIGHCRDILQGAEKKIEEIDSRGAKAAGEELEPDEEDAAEEEEQEEQEGLF